MKVVMKVLIIGLLTFFLGLFILIWLYLTYGKPWDKALFIEPIYKLSTEDKVVALTFDDGPSPTRTPVLLDLLDKYQIKATFFMIGQSIEQYSAIAEEVVNRGHQVSNHSYSHPRLIFKTPGTIGYQVDTTTQLLEGIGSKDTNYFRPPNTKKFILLPWLLKQRNINLVTGSYDPRSQYQTPFDADIVASQVVDNIEPGAIIYLHDGRDDSPEEFIKAVETIIVELKEKNYSFAKIKDFEY